MTLPTRPLGNTGIDVSLIGVGGGHIARKTIPESTTVRVIQRAVDEGVTFMDNAWEYHGGESERRMGIALQGRRDKVTIMTKVCSRDCDQALVQLEDSLRRFKTDYIDVWQFHEINYDNDSDWLFAQEGAIAAAIKARDAGKVRCIGFTGHKSPHILQTMLDRDFVWDTCQLPINACDYHYRSFQREILPQLVARGVGVIGMKSLGGDAQLITGAGLTAEQCRRYALSLPISVLVCGMESEENLEQDLAAVRDFQPYTEEELSALREQVKPFAADGRFEWFKSTQYYDSQTHRDQHGFPPIGQVGQPPAKEASP